MDLYEFFKSDKLKDNYEILTEEGNIDKDLVIEILFQEIKKLRIIVGQNKYAVDNINRRI